MPLKKEPEKICVFNTVKKTLWFTFSASAWLLFACMTTIMAASIFGEINNGRLKYKKVDLVFMTITQYQAAVLCTGGLFEVSALFLALRIAQLEREEEKKNDNCHCP